jgi:mRNA-degrading endonuclease RelE of RelBE toxin-antitoxin system
VSKQTNYSLLYAPEVHAHVKSVERTHLRLLEETIKEQLSHTPDQKTRNRKLLEETPGPFGATWELRCGPANQYRVFYEIVLERREVWILAIGVKVRNKLHFAGKEFPL